MQDNPSTEGSLVAVMGRSYKGVTQGATNMKTWNIDPSHSTVGFSIRHMVFSKVRGRFLKYTGALQLDDAIAKSWVEVTIDAASLDTGTAQRDTHLRSADFFDVETFPELRFRSTRVEEH